MTKPLKSLFLILLWLTCTSKVYGESKCTNTGSVADSSTNHALNNGPSSLISNSIVFPMPVTCQTNLTSKKHHIRYSFDLQGNLIGENLIILDDFGRTDFVQTRNFSTNKVIAAKGLYDKYGRLAITTLPAALGGSNFCYDDNFVNYDYNQFDLTPTTSNFQGEVYNPQPIDINSTLGLYYSNNSSHPTLPTSQFPYQRKFFTDNGHDEYIGSSGFDLNFLDINKRFMRTYELAPSNEYRYVYGVQGSHLLDENGVPLNLGDIKLRKQLTISPHGDILVSYISDKNQVVAKCRSENGSDCENQITDIRLIENSRSDFHLPSTQLGSMEIKFPDPGWWWKNSQQSNYCIDCFELEFYDVLSERTLVEGTDYNLNNDPLIDPTLYSVEFLNLPNGKPAVIGVSYKLSDQGHETFKQFLAYGNISLGPKITTGLDYNNWELYYYDIFGNLARTVQPEGVNCNFDANQVIDIKEHYGIVTHYDPADAGKKTILEFDLDSYQQSQLDNKLSLNIHPNFIASYTLDPGPPYWTIDPCIVEQIYGLEGPESGSAIELDEEQLTDLYQNLIEPREQFLKLSRINPNKPDDFANDPMSNRIFTPDKGGLIGMDVNVPPPSTYKSKQVKEFRHYFEVIVEGIDGSQNIDEFRRFYFEVVQTLTTYVVEDPITLDLEKSIYGEYKMMTGPSLSNELDWTSFRKYDDLVLQDYDGTKPMEYLENLSQYQSVRISVANATEYKKWYLIFDSNGGTLPTIETINSCRYAMGGNFGYHQYSIPDDIQHYALTEDYNYDRFGNLLESNVPDEGTTYYLYDQYQRLKFSEDENQRLSDRFSYNLYDKAGRIVERGFYNNITAAATSKTIDFTTSPPQTLDDGNIHYYLQDGERPDPAYCEDVTEFYFDFPTNDLPANLSNFEQKNLEGKLAKSHRYPTTTWYSYDFYGDIEWQISHNYSTGYETIRYIKNSAGDLVEIQINENDPNEDFYIKYTYDADKRLTHVHSSLDPQGPFNLNGKLEYDELGNLTRKELGDNLQGLDYVYTIQGNLKSINNPLPNYDIGGDEQSGSANYDGFKDLFSETLTYYAGDYQKNGTHIQSFSSIDFEDQFSGLIKGVTWNSSADLPFIDENEVLAYGLEYDNKGQLTNASYGNSAGGTLNGAGGGSAPTFEGLDTYDVNGIAYDLNGNIKSLNRIGPNSAYMDQLTYNYESNLNGELSSNHLNFVSDDVATLSYADELVSQQSNNYVYDAGGRLIEDKQRGIIINYNDEGLVIDVRSNVAPNNLIQDYSYDDAGRMYKTKYYDSQGTMFKRVFRGYDPAGNLLWEQSFVLDEHQQFIEGPRKFFVDDIGRVATVVISNNQVEENYEIKDHIGNVRVLFQSNKNLFSNSTFNSSIEGWNLNPNTTYETGGGLLSIYTDNDGGINKDFVVENGTRYSFSIDVGTISAPLLKAQLIDAGTSNVVAEYTLVTGSNRFHYRHNNTSDLSVNIIVPLSQEEGSFYFTIDNILIEEEDIEVLKYADYFPFGWEMPGRQYVSSTIDDDRGYQGDYSTKNNNLSWNEFQLRNYDPRIGRWLSIDPARQYHSLYMAMGNNPISVFDPDGAYGYKSAYGNEYIWIDNYYSDFFIDSDGNKWVMVARTLEKMDEVLGEGNYAVAYLSGDLTEDGSDAFTGVHYENGSENKLSQHSRGKIWRVVPVEMLGEVTIIGTQTKHDRAVYAGHYMGIYRAQNNFLVGVVENPATHILINIVPAVQITSLAVQAAKIGFQVAAKYTARRTLIDLSKKNIVRFTAEGGASAAARGSTTALRQVGKYFESVSDVMANPNLLSGKSLGQVRGVLNGSKGWVDDVMRRSSRAEGWVFREMNQAGTDFTGRMIQYHPGTPRHFGGAPYWKVSNGASTVRIPLN